MRKIYTVVVKSIVLGILMMGLLFTNVNYSEATVSEGHSIIVKKGDTLYRLSKQYNTSVDELKRLNNLSNNTIYIGQTLFVSSQKKDLANYYKVMVGSFSQEKNAKFRVQWLKSKGVASIVVPRVINGKTYYQVQAGSYETTKQANVQLNKAKKLGITDAYLLIQKELNINGVTLGDSENQLQQAFGKPTKIDTVSNEKVYYYSNQGVSIRATSKSGNNSFTKLALYIEESKENAGHDYPSTKQEMITQFGNPNKVKTTSCFETASCEEFVYQLDGQQLTVRLSWDGKKVEFIKLENL